MIHFESFVFFDNKIFQNKKTSINKKKFYLCYFCDDF